MNKNKKKLMLKRETLRDLTSRHAAEVKGGQKGGNRTKKCKPITLDCGAYTNDCTGLACW